MTIRETIRQAQDTLTRACRQPAAVVTEALVVSVRPLRHYWVSEYPLVQYPQSLGELALEEFANKIRRDAKFIDLWLRGYSLLSIEELVSLYALRIECEDLRRALYHRRTA